MAPVLGRGREIERFVRVVDLSFKRACLVFFSISMYYVLQYEHIIHGSEFRTCGADRNARVTGSSRPGSAIEGGFTTGRDRWMDRWIDGWMDGWSSDIWVELARTKKGDKVVLALAGGCESERRTPDDDGRSGTRNSRDVARVVAFGDSTSGGTTTVATRSWTTASSSTCCEETRVCGGSSCTESHSKAKSANCTRRNGRYDSAWRMERRYRPS